MVQNIYLYKVLISVRCLFNFNFVVNSGNYHLDTYKFFPTDLTDHTEAHWF